MASYLRGLCPRFARRAFNLWKQKDACAVPLSKLAPRRPIVGGGGVIGSSLFQHALTHIKTHQHKDH